MAHGRRLYYRTRSGTASNILFDDVHASWTVEDLLRKIQDEQKMQESLSDLNLYKAHGGPCLDRELEVNSFEEDIGTKDKPVFVSTEQAGLLHSFPQHGSLVELQEFDFAASLPCVVFKLQL